MHMHALHLHIFRPVGFYLILHNYTEGSGAYGPFPLYHLSFYYFLNQFVLKYTCMHTCMHTCTHILEQGPHFCVFRPKKVHKKSAFSIKRVKFEVNREYLSQVLKPTSSEVNALLIHTVVLEALTEHLLMQSSR